MSPLSDTPTSARIMICEDERLLAEDLEKSLKDHGYEIIRSVPTGEEALRLAEEYKPDLVLMDIKLAGKMDGIEAAEQIRSLMDTAVIYVTAHSESDVFERAKFTEPYAYLTKPVSPQELIRNIRMAVYKRQVDIRLKESESKYRNLVQQSLQGLVIAQSDPLRLSFASEPMQEITGYTPDELVGFGSEELIALIHEEDREEFFENFRNRLAGRDVAPRNQHRIIHRTGKIRWVEMFSSLIRYNGEPASQMVFIDITDRILAEEALKESEARIRLKLNSILEPEGNVGDLELADVIDTEAIQSLMDDFHSLTNIGMAILDIKGRVLVKTGWQDICTHFHRAHPETNKNCIMSDTLLSSGVEEGQFRLYRCKNNMWDIATPIMIGGIHLGNLFLGQFLFEDESPDYEVFRNQARRYGFDEEAYITALDRVPRWDRETVDRVMTFYSKLCRLVSELSFSNIKLARSLSERDELVESLRRSNSEVQVLLDCSKAILDHQDFSVAARMVFDKCREATGATSGYVALLSEDGSENEVLFLESGGLPCSVDPSLPMPIRGLRGEVYREGAVAYENDFSKSKWMKFMPEGHVRLENVLFAPLNIEGKTVGLVGLANKAGGFDEKDARIAGAIGALAAVGLSRAKAVTALEQSEERFRLAMHASNDGLWDWDIRTGEVYRNPAFYSMLGYEPEEFPWGFEGWKELLHPDDADFVMAALNAYLSGKSATYEVEFRIAVKSNEYIWVLTRGKVVERDRTGNPLRMIGTHTDITERKRTEEKLKESEERYRTLFERAGDGIIVIDLEDDGLGKIVSANPAAARMHGYDLDEFLGLSMSDLDAPQEADQMAPIIARVNRGEMVKTEHWHKKKDGSLFPMELRAGVIEIAGHKYSLSINRDMAERIQAEKALKKSEERYRFLVDRAPIGIVSVDRDGRILDVNEKLLEILGSPSAEATKSINMFTFPPLVEAGISGVFKRCIQDGLLSSEEILYNSRWGKTSLLRITASPIREGENAISGCLAVVEDFTERKKAEESVRRSKETLEAILNNIPVMVAFHDRQGNIRYINRCWQETLGWTLQEAQDRDLLADLYPDEDYIATLAGSWSEFDTVARDGRQIKTSWVNIPLPDGSKIGIGLDITELKKTQEERENLQRQISQAQKMESIGTLAGGIAHDFNNILQVVSGHAELLELELAQKGMKFDEMNAIRHASQRGADLVKQILTFSRKVESKFEVIDLNEDIKTVERLLYRTIPKMIDIQLMSDEQPKLINADSAQVEQILLNLAVNAKDAMPQGGTLTISTKYVIAEQQYCAGCGNRFSGKYVLLTVSDTGHGMTEEVMDHIFEPFYTTKLYAEGTGLGLATVLGIVHLHGGHINCESEVRKGTTFSIYFPVVEATETEPESHQEPDEVAGGSETILVVDDEQLIADLAKRILEKAGYRVITANSGKEALAIYAQRKSGIALVILDLIMPEMGGEECLKELLKINPQVKTLIASGYAIKGTTKTYLDTEAKGRVTKPFNMRELLRSVRHILDGARAPIR